MIKATYRKVKSFFLSANQQKQIKIRKYINYGRIPWSEGYAEYKAQNISNAISDDNTLQFFRSEKIPIGYGIGIDERIVEYPWLFSQLTDKKSLLLDAGSTFNFDFILDQETLNGKKIHICTFHPESPNYNQKGISYVYADIRSLPYKDALFDEIVCQSTIEHIDMDNSIYGYSPDCDISDRGKSYSYLGAIDELVRVLRPKGNLLLTFPFGKYENHIFFQQFDDEMLSGIERNISGKGRYTMKFIRYSKSGWSFAERNECTNMESYNPHTGKGKKDDGAAHCRCVCVIKFTKD